METGPACAAAHVSCATAVGAERVFTDADDLTCAPHEWRPKLEREGELYNMLLPMLRRHEDGVVFFDSPHRLDTLEKHNRMRFLSILSADGDSKIDDMLEALVRVARRGSIDKFWMYYRSGDLMVARAQRPVTNVCYSCVDAYVVPHVLQSPDGGAGHTVLFVCYPRMNPPRIVMYDPTYAGCKRALVPRLCADDVRARYNAERRAEKRCVRWHAERVSENDHRVQAARAHAALFARDGATFEQTMAMHALENYMHAIEMVYAGLVPGSNSVERVRASKPEQHGRFRPHAYEFYVDGYGMALSRRESMAFVCHGIGDLAQNWRCADGVHVMSLRGDEQRIRADVFSTPTLRMEDYVALVALDIVKRFSMNWRVVQRTDNEAVREITPSRVFQIGSGAMEPYVKAFQRGYRAAYRYVFTGDVQDVCTGAPWVDATDMQSNQVVDVVVRYVDCKSSARFERETHDHLARRFSCVRYMITVEPYKAVTVNYRESVYPRMYAASPAYTLVYRMPPGATHMTRASDAHTARSALLSTFPPHSATRKKTFSVELPESGTHVTWVTGLGWMPTGGR